MKQTCETCETCKHRSANTVYPDYYKCTRLTDEDDPAFADDYYPEDPIILVRLGFGCNQWEQL